MSLTSAISSSHISLSISSIPTELEKQTSLKKFKKELKDYYIFDQEVSQVAKNLFAMAPKHLSLDEIVDMIFKVCKHNHALFLDAILYAHPTFTLSPLDTIRRAIVEDTEHTLNNHSLRELLKKQGLEEDTTKCTACWDLAFRNSHPHIYSLASQPVPTSDYTLNFLWINLNPQDRIQDKAQSIFKEGLDCAENAECIKDIQTLRKLEKTEKSLEKEDLENWQNIKKSFAYRVAQWAEKQPSGQINIWYDSALVTQKAQQKTLEMMKSIAESRGVDLRLRDIRQLSNIKGEIEHALHPGTPLYFRVDLLKALIADYMMSSSKEKAKYCIVSDIDVKPMTVDQLFDVRTMDYLSSQGYVFNRNGLSSFENSFFIFNKEKENLQKIHYESIIHSIASMLESLRKYPTGTYFRPEDLLGSTAIFQNYRVFRSKMSEKVLSSKAPRKAVDCPRSQFNYGGSFCDSDHQSETFRFISDKNIPYTKKGRSGSNLYETPIKELASWKAEPLKSKSSD